MSSCLSSSPSAGPSDPGDTVNGVCFQVPTPIDSVPRCCTMTLRVLRRQEQKSLLSKSVLWLIIAFFFPNNSCILMWGSLLTQLGLPLSGLIRHNVKNNTVCKGRWQSSETEIETDQKTKTESLGVNKGGQRVSPNILRGNDTQLDVGTPGH